MTVVFSPRRARSTSPMARRLEMQADSESLDVVLNVPDDAEDERMRGVVASHLDRFAFREAPLTFDWRTP